MAGPNNVAPLANAGGDQSVQPRTRVYLDANASSDPDGVIVAYQRQQLSGRTVSLANADSAIANFRAPGVKRGRTRMLVFELTVTDDDGATSTDQVTITVAH